MSKERQENIKNIVEALKKVKPDHNATIISMVNEMSEKEIIIDFNQRSLDFFNFLIDITKQRGEESVYGLGKYLKLYEGAVFVNKSLPIDQFSMIVLLHAPLIYDKKEEEIMNLHMPNKEIELKEKNEFAMLYSDKFKKLWHSLNKTNKNTCIDHIIALTSYSHAYFYKTVLSQIN